MRSRGGPERVRLDFLSARRSAITAAHREPAIGGWTNDADGSRRRATGTRARGAGAVGRRTRPPAALRRRYGARGPHLVGDDGTARGGAAVGPGACRLFLDAGLPRHRVPGPPRGEPPGETDAS